MKSINNPKLDRRVKLLPEQREEVLALKESISQRKCAKMFNVSRRLVQFIWYPEKAEENKLRRAERGGSSQYYDKDSHSKAMKDHRNYKRQLIKENKI